MEIITPILNTKSTIVNSVQQRMKVTVLLVFIAGRDENSKKHQIFFQITQPVIVELYKAFQKYLQTLFIANKTYPIAYNKWIKEQVVEWLNMPDLYPQLSTIISIPEIESDEINDKAKILRGLLNNLTNGIQ